VTRSGVLALRMLRYRVATMIWLFMLLGAASRDGLGGLGWRHALAAAALGAAYVAATTQNDVADRKIDLVNHPRDPGRPLVSGDATVHDLRVLHLVATVAAVVAAAAIGAGALALVGLSLGIGWAYSLPPLRLAYRTYLTSGARRRVRRGPVRARDRRRRRGSARPRPPLRRGALPPVRRADRAQGLP